MERKSFIALFSLTPLFQSHVISFSHTSHPSIFYNIVAKMPPLNHAFCFENQSQMNTKCISRRTSHGFNLKSSHVIDNEGGSNKCNGCSTRDSRVCTFINRQCSTTIFYVSFRFFIVLAVTLLFMVSLLSKSQGVEFTFPQRQL